MLLVVGAMVWTYSVNSESLAVNFDETGQGNFFLSKEAIFYIAMALFLVNNVVIVAVKGQIKKIPVSMMPIPNRMAWGQNRPELDEFLENWLYGVVGMINVVLGVSLFALATVNSLQFDQNVFDFSWLMYVTLVLLFIVFLLIPLQLFRPPAPEVE